MEIRNFHRFVTFFKKKQKHRKADELKLTTNEVWYLRSLDMHFNWWGRAVKIEQNLFLTLIAIQPSLDHLGETDNVIHGQILI
jgi:hypothetical protein